MLFGSGVLLFKGGRVFERIAPWLAAALLAALAIEILLPGVWIN